MTTTGKDPRIVDVGIGAEEIWRKTSRPIGDAIDDSEPRLPDPERIREVAEDIGSTAMRLEELLRRVTGGGSPPRMIPRRR